VQKRKMPARVSEGKRGRVGGLRKGNRGDLPSLVSGKGEGTKAKERVLKFRGKSIGRGENNRRRTD